MKDIIFRNDPINEAKEQLEAAEEEIKECKGNIDEQLEKISEAWKGADAIAYVQRMKDDYAVILDRYTDSLETCWKILPQVYQKYNDFDENRPEVL